MLIGMNSAAKTAQQSPAPAANDAAANVIYDVSSAEFETKVMRASMERPVLIDFWATWCGPCKQLGPILEAAVLAKQGQVALAKVDIDRNPELAQAFRVQSVPMVVALYMGQPVGAFAGVRPAADIEKLLDQLVKMHQQNQPQALDIPAALKQAAELLAAQDLAGAQQIYGAILHQDEHNAQAYCGLIRIMIAAGEMDQAEALLTQAPEKIAKDPAFAAAKTAIELARTAPTDDVANLKAKTESDPQNPQVWFDYAEACFGQGLKDEAVEALVKLIRVNRAWEDEKGRKQLLRYFEAWGPIDPATISGRKRLSAVLFS